MDTTITSTSFKEWLKLREQHQREALMGDAAAGTDERAWTGEPGTEGPSPPRREEDDEPATPFIGDCGTISAEDENPRTEWLRNPAAAFTPTPKR